jgi:hypothetical protein
LILQIPALVFTEMVNYPPWFLHTHTQTALNFHQRTVIVRCSFYFILFFYSQCCPQTLDPLALGTSCLDLLSAEIVGMHHHVAMVHTNSKSRSEHILCMAYSSRSQDYAMSWELVKSVEMLVSSCGRQSPMEQSSQNFSNLSTSIYQKFPKHSEILK